MAVLNTNDSLRIPKKHKCFGIKIYKLHDLTGYTCDMKTNKMTAAHNCEKYYKGSGRVWT
jgi:hypothetical protein